MNTPQLLSKPSATVARRAWPIRIPVSRCAAIRAISALRGDRDVDSALHGVDV